MNHPNNWSVDVQGVVFRAFGYELTAIPTGRYTMEKHGFDRYELFGEDGRYFALTTREVSAARYRGALTIDEPWP